MKVGDGMSQVVSKEFPILFQGDMVRAILAGRKTQTRRIINQLTGFGKVTEFGRSDTRGYDWCFRDRRMRWNDINTDRLMGASPKGGVGDTLYVRESWSNPIDTSPGTYLYRADYPSCVPDEYENIPDESEIEWKPSIHMPSEARRLFLGVVKVRVERVQSISDNDAVAEGIECVRCSQEPEYGVPGLAPAFKHYQNDQFNRGRGVGARHSFQTLWDSINAKPKPIKRDQKIIGYESFPWGGEARVVEHRGLPHKIISNPFVWVYDFDMKGAINAE